MPTDHIKYWLPDFISGKIDERSQAVVEQHIRECGECLRELEELKETFAELAKERPLMPSPQYFGTILPRVRQRLGGKSRSIEFFWQPFLTRFIMPLGAAVVAFALLFQTSLIDGAHGGSVLAERPMFSDYSAQELFSAYLEEGRLRPLTTTPPSQSLEELISDNTVGNRIAKRLLGSNEIVEEGVSVIPASQLIADLNDRELEILLKRLGERDIL